MTETEPGFADLHAQKIWVVVAAYNESRRIGQVVSGLRRGGFQVIVVDDGSVDDTGQIAADAGAYVARHIINRGQGAALQTGMEFAISRDAQILVTFDADDQHDPADIPSMVEPILSGTHDVVLGSRFLGESPGIPMRRKWLLKAAVAFTRMTTGLFLTDAHNGLRAFSASAASKIRITEDRMAHASELLHQIAEQQMRVIEKPVTVRYDSETLEKGQRNGAAVGILARLVVNRLFQP